MLQEGCQNLVNSVSKLSQKFVKNLSKICQIHNCSPRIGVYKINEEALLASFNKIAGLDLGLSRARFQGYSKILHNLQLYLGPKVWLLILL